MPRVSILTPSWNRGKFLPKVYAALAAQTVQDFEWIVVDDGSEDGTQAVMQKLLEKSSFPVTFAYYSKRVGKCRADNTLLDLAQGDRVLWCDSDDVLVPNAIERMLEVWDGIPLHERDEYIAVMSLCIDDNGHIQSTGLNDFRPFSSSWSDVSKLFGISGDMCIMLNHSLVVDARFPEVDLVMSESGLWKQFMDMKVICLSDPLKIMTRNTINRISGSSRMEYCRGKVYAILLADKEDYAEMSFKRKVRTASNLIRYSIHGDLDIRETKMKFGLASRGFLFKIGSCLGRCLALKDMLQKRVYKSHVIFEAGRDAVINVVRNKRIPKEKI